MVEKPIPKPPLTGAPDRISKPATPAKPAEPTPPPAPHQSAPARTPPRAESEATAQPKWTYSLETGPGMALLVGDIGVANQQITIVKPNGTTDRLTSGHKPEFGPGGFESYAQFPGSYKIQFMGQSFDVPLEGKFTRITFEQLVGADSVKVGFALRDSRSSFNVGEKVFARIEVTNISEEPIHFGILGLLTDAGQFQTSWTDGNIAPGDTFRHEDGLAYDAPGRHTLQLSICFARKERCTSGQAEDSWVRFQPPLEVVVA